MADKELNCVQCGDAFWFRGGEQTFFRRHDLAPPRRCVSCRDARKIPERHDPRYEAFEGEGFPAVCGACGAATRLPFEPSAERPVYCKECFRYR